MSRKKLRSIVSALLAVLMLFSGMTTAFAEPAEDVTVYLSDIAPINPEVGWGSLGVDKGLDGKTLKIKTSNGNFITYERGFCAHAESKLTFDISGRGVKRFQSYIGIHDGTDNNRKDASSCGFIVKADGVTLYTSEVLRYEMDPVLVDIAIPEGTEQLVLISTDGGDDVTGDHSAWFDAKLILDGAVQKNLKSISLVAESTMISLNSSSNISVSGKLVDDTIVDFLPSELSFVSSDPEIATVTGDGKVTALKDGIATITCTAERDGIQKSGSLMFIIGNGDPQSSWAVTSPDGSVKAVFTLMDGAVTFASSKDGRTVVESSPTGLVTNLGDFRSGLTFISREDQEINDSYSLIGSKVTNVDSHAMESTLNFEKDGVNYSIIVRAYDDGIAFRYTIRTEDGAELRISSENTGFQLPQKSVAQAMTYVDHHEAVAYEKQISELSGNYCMPFLYQTPGGDWALLSEAALSVEYCGAIINANSDGLAKVVFSPEQKGDVVTSSPFVTPWRFAVIGTPADITETVMPENLSPDCVIEDTSWIEPGVTAWTWLNRESTSSYEVYKKYVDFAAEMGWQYLLLDEGWRPKAASGTGLVYDGYYDWVYDLLDYAEEKGVGLLAWENHSDLNTPAKQERIQELADMGFKGIKPDFFNSQSQSAMVLYDQLMKKTAECHMLLNPHGANKTTGERRTYPNTLTREGIFGHEQELFRPTQVSARHNCMLPFTRCAIGPGDYTPMLSYRNSGGRTSFSLAHMAALTVVLESGIQCLADRPEVYRESPAYAFFKALPTDWDTSFLVEGEPGNYVNMARQSGDNWYLGIICDEARTAEFSLDFLDEGTYYAFIYKDGESLNDIAVEMKEVSKEDTLSIPLLATGGAAVKIVKNLPSQPDSISLNKSQLMLNKYESETLNAAISPEESELNDIYWTSSNPNVATVAGGKVTAVKPGATIITASTGFGGKIKATCRVTVAANEYELLDNWSIVRGDSEMWALNGESSITITTQPGELYTNTANAKNIFLTPATSENFTITTKLTFDPYDDYHTAGLIVYAGDDKVFGAVRRSHSSFNGNILATFSLNGTSFSEQYVADPDHTAPIYIKLVKEGANLSMFYSMDNVSWVKVKNTVVNNALGGSDVRIGLYAVTGNNKVGAVPATFENLTYYEGSSTQGTVLSFAEKTVPDSSVSNDATAYVGEEFSATVITPEEFTTIRLVNENGKSVGIQNLDRRIVDGKAIWEITTFVGSAGEGRRLSVYAKRANGTYAYLGQDIVFDVNTRPAAVLEASFDRAAAKVNEMVQTTAETTSGTVKIKMTNENGRVIGKYLVSKTRNMDGTITWVYEVCFGSSGMNKTITYSAAGKDGIYTDDTANASLIVVK